MADSHPESSTPDRPDVRVTLSSPAEQVFPTLTPAQPGAVAVMAHTHEGYTTNVPLPDLQDGGALLALKHDGQDLPSEHGGPCRLLIPKLYFWKSAKWIRSFEFLDVNAPGFWEVNGYHLHADPWKEERYSDQETDAMQRMRSEAARRLRGRS